MAGRQIDWDLVWRRCFRDGRQWFNRVNRYRWNFSNLEDAFDEGGMWEDAAFEEGGMLDGKKLYFFTHVEVLFPEVNDPQEQIYIPVFIGIESPFPLSDKIAFKSLQTGEYEKIVDMKSLKLRWTYFWYLGPRRIRALDCCFYIARSGDLNHCTPYFYNPFKVGTTVDIVYQTQAEAEPLHFEYHWEEEPEIFTDALITFNLLPAAHKDSFLELLWERRKKWRRAYRKVLPDQERLRAQGIDADAFENMRFYKFYPVATDDTPDISSVKTRFINKYFGDADFVF